MSRYGAIRDELRAALTPECFALLIERFGGRVIRIPERGILTQLDRRRREREMIDDGETYRATAEAVGVATSTVVRDMKRAT